MQAFERDAAPLLSVILPPSPLTRRFEDRTARVEANPTAGR
jgi:hypothetical protein